MSEKDQPQPKVLLVGPRCSTGGIARFVDSCLQAVSGAAIHLFDVARPPKKQIAFRANGYNELFNAGLGRAINGIAITFKHILNFPGALLRSRAQIVHLTVTGWFPFWEFSVYGLLSKLLGKKVIFHFLGPFNDFYQRSSRLPRFFIRLIMNAFDVAIVESYSNQSVLERFFPSERIFIVPNGVQQVPDVIDLSTDNQRPLRVLFLGGVDPIRKGLMDLIKAASIIATKGPNVEWIIGGSETAFRVINEQCPVEVMPYVHFVGLMSESEKNAKYQSSDVFVLPSYEEGMPYAILEAMAYGLPVISTRIGGIPEVVAEGINGYLLEPGDYRGIANLIDLLSRNTALRQQISLQNRKMIEERFSEEYVFQQIGKVYLSLIS